MTDRSTGFVRLPNWLIDEPGHLTINELVVYLSLLRSRDPQTGQCYPGFTLIAERSRLSRSTVKRVIPELERRGIIHVDRGGPKTNNRYTVKLPEEAFPPGITENLAGVRLAPPSEPSEAFLGGSTVNPPRSTVNPAGFTEELGLGPQWSPRKNHREIPIGETHQQAATVDESTAPAGFTEIHPPPSITDAQLDYLKDLYLHITGEPAPGPQLDSWTKLTVAEADDVISTWKKSFEHATDYTGPEPGTDAYDALTATGQAWADAQMVKEDFIAPDSHIVEDKILKHLQRHGARTNRQLRDALTTEQRRSLKPILNRLIDDGTITTAEHYSSPAATRPGLVYSLTDPDERTA